MAEVSLQNISKIYEPDNLLEKKAIRKRAVDDISFTVRDKEFMVLVGPSGCGKSTLLRMIAGLEEISEGTLSIDGKRINDLSPRDRDIAMVFQNYALYPHMTVYDNMAFGLKLKHFSKSEIKLRVTETAQMLELQDELNRKPKHLSGGQRQRVAIGRAIIRRPKVFLFDEPLSNLDAKLRSQMRVELQKLHREIDATMIYVTHDQVEAMTLGDRIALLNKGKLMQLDTPMRLYNFPENKFAAGFIGSPPMNFIRGILRKEGENFLIEMDGNCRFILKTAPLIFQQKMDAEIEIGVRPENVILGGKINGDRNVCHVIVEAIENMGNEQVVHLSLNKQTIIARVMAELSVEIGNRYPLNLNENKMIFIDVETGQVMK